MNIDGNGSARRCANVLWNKNKIEENDSDTRILYWLTLDK